MAAMTHTDLAQTGYMQRPQTLLQTENLSKHFGGLLAVDSVSLELPRGEIHAIIGPNGAGKTTLVNLISGHLLPDTGSILFNGHNITRHKSYTRATNGIVYTFQVTSIFKNLSCYENVALAAQRRAIHTLLHRLAVPEKVIARRVEKALSQIGLQDVSNRQADELPYGHQRLLEVAMSLALEPKLLILDEPTQGLAQSEINELAEHIKALVNETTILLIEHNMPFVLDLAERVTVMDNGKIIAQNTPTEIECNPQVQKAYLGT